jgi:histone acetyltransferase (RNA polymerase elongator complex component)
MSRIFDDSDFRPDEMQIYPMVVTPHSELEHIWREGGFISYDDETLIDLMADLQGRGASGYDYARDHDITDSSYDNGNSESFNEGVREYAEDQGE